MVSGQMSHLLLLGLAEKGGLLVLGGDCIIKLARVPQNLTVEVEIDDKKRRNV